MHCWGSVKYIYFYTGGFWDSCSNCFVVFAAFVRSDKPKLFKGLQIKVGLSVELLVQFNAFCAKPFLFLSVFCVLCGQGGIYWDFICWQNCQSQQLQLLYLLTLFKVF